MIARATRSQARKMVASQSLHTVSLPRFTSAASSSRILFNSTSPTATSPSSSLSAQLRASNAFKPIRHNSSKTPADPIASDDPSSSSSTFSESEDRFANTASEELLQAPSESNRQPIGKVERRLSITFTCTVPECGHRSSHEFSRHAYEKGIVLCQCPQCFSRHLIADHLGWFDSDDLTQGGKYKTIEELLASKGEKVARAKILPDGTMEIESKDDLP